MVLSVLPPVHSAVSLGYCNRHGVPQVPELRTAWWREAVGEVTWKKAVGEAGTHSCGRNASFGLP